MLVLIKGVVEVPEVALNDEYHFNDPEACTKDKILAGVCIWQYVAFEVIGTLGLGFTLTIN